MILCSFTVSWPFHNGNSQYYKIVVYKNKCIDPSGKSSGFSIYFFMNASAEKQCSSFTDLRTWTHAILTSFKNFENLHLKMEEELILVHNRTTRFARKSSFMTTSLFATIVIFKKEQRTFKAWPSRKAFTITPYFPTLRNME